MKLIIDSSVFISSLGKEDIYSADSRSFFKKSTNDNIIIPSLVAAEVVTILRKQDAKNVNQILKNMVSLTFYPLNEIILKEIVDLPKSTLNLKTSDLIVALTAKIEKGILVTWDKQLLKYGTEICSVKTPKMVI